MVNVIHILNFLFPMDANELVRMTMIPKNELLERRNQKLNREDAKDAKKNAETPESRNSVKNARKTSHFRRLC
ncbi:MAG: hypothetical protein DMG05_24805 [Acidobacteria bacterium]|nr:MAG: hypothetical protein DMG05_24805 [Acidobacteriota bacterium]